MPSALIFACGLALGLGLPLGPAARIAGGLWLFAAAVVIGIDVAFPEGESRADLVRGDAGFIVSGVLLTGLGILAGSLVRRRRQRSSNA